MTRPLKFRAKRLDNGRWVYGSLIQYERATPDIYTPETSEFIAVDVKTIGEWTGLRDMQTNDIYENDILRYVSPENQEPDARTDIYEVEWKGFGFEARWANPPTPRSQSDGHLSLTGADEDMELIGNLHENPELLTQSTGAQA